DRGAEQVPGAGAPECRGYGPAAAPRAPGGARLVDRAARLAGRTRTQRLDGDARRRARQLVRPLAAAGPARRARRGADRGPPAGRVRVEACARGIMRPPLAGEVVWLHRSLPSF